MLKIRILSIVLYIFFCYSSISGQETRNVVLISIDGLRPEFFLDSIWPTPNLRLIKNEGMYSDKVFSVFPSYTYPAHAAMVSGALPARSGIIHNIKDEKTGEWYWKTEDIKSTTIWDLVESQGMTSAAIQWPSTVGGKIRYNVPEIWDPANPSDRISMTRKFASDGLINEIEVNVTGKLDSFNMHEDFSGLDENSAKIAAYVYRKYRPNLLAVHFAGVDGKQHSYGRSHKEVDKAVARIDYCVGLILESIERCGDWGKTSIIVVGDHGFADVQQVLRPRQWLKDVPYEFKVSGGSAFLFPKNYSQNHIENMPSVLRDLDGIPENQRKLFRVIMKPELNELGVDSNAVLALAAYPGTVFSSKVEGGQMDRIIGGHHGYDPRLPEMQTGLIVCSPNVLRGRMSSKIAVQDIFQILKFLLNLKSDNVDSKFNPELFIHRVKK